MSWTLLEMVTSLVMAMVSVEEVVEVVQLLVTLVLFPLFLLFLFHVLFLHSHLHHSHLDIQSGICALNLLDQQVTEKEVISVLQTSLTMNEESAVEMKMKEVREVEDFSWH